MMKYLSGMGVLAALVVCMAAPWNQAVASNDSFAAGSARVSAPCKIQFDARSNGGHVTEQCDFESGRQLFVGRVVCFAASGNAATFVWQMEIAPEGKEGMYQQVVIADNGAPGHGVPDGFLNYPEQEYNPCPYLPPPSSVGTNPILSGNLVVSAE